MILQGERAGCGCRGRGLGVGAGERAGCGCRGRGPGVGKVSLCHLMLPFKTEYCLVC